MNNEFLKLSNGDEILKLEFGLLQIPPEENKDGIKKTIEEE